MIEFSDWDDSEIQELFMEAAKKVPELMADKHQMQLHRIPCVAVLVPDRFHVRYVGEGHNPDVPATMLGLPVIYNSEEKWGIVSLLVYGEEDDE